MNRNERRAAVARGKAATGAAVDIADLMTEASRAHEQGRSAQAEIICRQILVRMPAHKTSLNLLGVINQTAGRHKAAVKMFARAIALDDLDAACHYNIAASYQVLGQYGSATTHFKRAIALGMSGKKDVEEFIMQNTAVIECVRRITAKSSLPVKIEEVFEARDIAAVANDVFIRCALETTVIRGVTLELFLTHLRAALLHFALPNIHDPAKVDGEVINLFCAVAQQCFLNEYVYAQGDEETRHAAGLRALLLQKLSDGDGVSSLLLAAVAAYFPLHSLAGAISLLAAPWPSDVADLLQRQVREPLEEADDRSAIPALTAIDDGISLQVRQQYEENPYPRWTINRLAVMSGDMERHPGMPGGDDEESFREILIAGCGTGQHAFDSAQYFPDARILAVDISRASLAYARRKTREEGLQNVEYAQADILKLGSIGRSFDLIEAVGVLHHLADPKAGWRVLLSLLKRGGIMRIGLYSETARRSVVAARTLIAERGYRPATEDIRALRQIIIRNSNEPHWKTLTRSIDFYNMSGCRDMLFNVMEHRFSIPEIAAFLNEQGLSFLGFDLDAATIEKFQQQHPGAEALGNLDDWNAFEAANPLTFVQMYVFTVRASATAPAAA
jgi:SAM-dependent methyltransferase